MKINYKKYLSSPLLLIALACFLLAGISLIASSHTSLSNATSKKINTAAKIPLLTPKPTPVVTQKSAVITKIPTSIEMQVTTTPRPTTASLTNTNSTNATPMPTAVSQSSATISLQLSEPNGNFSYRLSFTSGSNPCSVLTDAKNAGDINSVTIMHYGAPLNSDYVKEINGYSDNWTFTLNGTSEPQGCSNYSLSSGDNVAWKYN